MKRIFGILLLATLVVAAPVSAQFDLGLKAGLNLAGSPSDLSSTAFKADGYTGFFVGPMAKFTMPLIGIGIEGDILYSQSGSKLNGHTIKKNSIEIPIYLRYDMALPLVSKIIVPFVAVGPQFGFGVGSMSSVFDFEGVNSKYQFKKSNISLNLGLGAILFKHVQVHLNYNMPLGKTSELSFIDTGGSLLGVKDSKTKIWQLSLAYLF